MSTTVSLKEFIIERLTAAAADIFSACEQTIVRYEEEIDRQRRLLEISLKPRINLTRIDIKQHKALATDTCFTVDPQDQMIHDQDEQKPPLNEEDRVNFNLKIEEEPEKSEPETESTSTNFLQHDVSKKATCSEQDHQDYDSERMIIDNNQEEEKKLSQIKEEQQGLNPLQSSTEHENLEVSLKHENDIFIVTLISDKHDQEEPGLDDESPPSRRLAADQSQDQSQSKHVDSASTVEENNNTTSQEKNKNVLDALDTESESALKCDVCGKTLRKVSVKQQKTMSKNLCLCSTCDERPRKKKKKKSCDKNQRVCEICSKTFSSLQHVNIHMRTHTGERPYVCTTCGKGFFQLNRLNQHEITHTTLKPFSCKTCNKQFRRLGHLFSHVRIHTGEKPFSCKMCEKKFSRQCSLRRHVRTHTRERPYRCDICEKTYMQATHLTQHKLTHTGHKRFSCQTCAKAYFYPSDLLRHKKKLHS